MGWHELAASQEGLNSMDFVCYVSEGISPEMEFVTYHRCGGTKGGMVYIILRSKRLLRKVICKRIDLSENIGLRKMP
jgi:hypothetical protein